MMRSAVVAAVLAALPVAAWPDRAHARHVDTLPASDASSRRPGTPAAAWEASCPRPAPPSVEGYQRLWSTIPVEQWGAADVSLSVRLGSRRVWLYGDTISARPGGFVHSSAVTQDRGCLHVSHAGAQLLPDSGRRIFWIHRAWRAADSVDLIRIRARAVEVTGQGAWAFRDGGYFRIATVRLEESGDLTFLRWGRSWRTPEPDPGPLIDFDGPGPGHFGYSIQQHGRLPDGRRLMTISQSWDDGGWHGWERSRPLFFAEGEEPWRLHVHDPP